MRARLRSSGESFLGEGSRRAPPGISERVDGGCGCSGGSSVQRGELEEVRRGRREEKGKGVMKVEEEVKESMLRRWGEGGAPGNRICVERDNWGLEKNRQPRWT